MNDYSLMCEYLNHHQQQHGTKTQQRHRVAKFLSKQNVMRMYIFTYICIYTHHTNARTFQMQVGVSVAVTSYMQIYVRSNSDLPQ